MTRRRHIAATVVSMVVLAAGTVAAFLPAAGAELVSWDDFANIRDNPQIRGFGDGHFSWMWKTFYMGVWQPLGWIVYTILYDFIGTAPRAYHVFNLVLHTLNVLVFFFIARQLIRAARRSTGEGLTNPERESGGHTAGALCAALLFGIHPLRAEAVAWATCQPYLLAGLFCLLSVAAYVRAAEAVDPRKAKRWLRISIAAYVVSLLSKSIAVPLPAILLVLDVYPLRRMAARAAEPANRGEIGRRLIEKIPFIALSAATVVLAWFATRGNAPLAQALGPLDRLAVSAFGAVFYLRKSVWPTGLIAFNRIPLPMQPLAWPFVASAAAAIAVAGVLFVQRRRWPGAAAAGIVYLLMLAPLLGLVQHGAQLAADRYSYLSCMPWAVLVGAALEQALGRRRGGARRAILGIGATCMAGLGVATFRQVGVWENSLTLWEHDLTVDPDSSLAHGNRGAQLCALHRYDEALAAIERSVALDARNADAWTGLGMVHAARGELDEARRCSERALEIDPASSSALLTLGRLASAKNDLPAATDLYERALRCAATEPPQAEARHLLAETCFRRGLALAGNPAAPNRERLTEAIELVGRAAVLVENNYRARGNLCSLLQLRGGANDYVEAVAQGRRAIQLRPDYAIGHYQLAGALARLGAYAEARRENEIALRLGRENGDKRVADLSSRRAAVEPVRWFDGER